MNGYVSGIRHGQQWWQRKVLKRRDIQVEASILVAEAEWVIAAANPPQAPGRPRTGEEKTVKPDNSFSYKQDTAQDNFVKQDDEVSPEVIRQVRQAHSSLSDEQFQEVANRAREEGEPLTRSVLKREARKLNPPAEDEPEKPKGPTRTEELEAQVDALKMEVDEKAARIEELEEQVRFLKGELSEYPHEREAMFNRQQAIINAQRAELATERSLHNELKRTHQGALRRIKKLEEHGTPVQSPPEPTPVDAAQSYEAAAPEPPIEDFDDHPTHGDEEEEYWDMKSLPPDDQPEGRDSGDRESDPWEGAQRVGPFRIGEYVVMPSGNHGVIQGPDGEGRALVSTEYGVGRIEPFELEELQPEAV